MTQKHLATSRVRKLLDAASRARILVLGDVMLDHFLWGKVGRISPEAPVPVVEFERETFMAGGAGNVARNLADLNVAVELFGVIGCDDAAVRLKQVLKHDRIGCVGLLAAKNRGTSIKTRVLVQRQQVVRIDRETRFDADEALSGRLFRTLEAAIGTASAVIVADYAKGVVTQPLLDALKRLCRRRAVWLSVDPKPAHHLDLTGLSLLTPNRKEAFELAGAPDQGRGESPAQDAALLGVADKLLGSLKPALLLITLGDQGLLLCQTGRTPFHIPTAAREVFDVSGAGDTTIASFTMAIAAGASPVEAAIFSNHAAGVVVGKVGTATVQPHELLESFRRRGPS
jgi:D-beta-D-heptose 7-phosphate kinase/D-beta-D-heptose 1-phosphate adenosyltransferase